MYKVVIIDDEPIIVQGLSRSIPWEQFDCEVIGVAGNGKEGRELILKTQPDIIFLDICMPEMDGLTMVASLKSEYEAMQVSILTGFRDFEYAQKALTLGVSRYLLKPSNMDEIYEAISYMVSVLARRQGSVLRDTGGTGNMHERIGDGSSIVHNGLDSQQNGPHAGCLSGQKESEGDHGDGDSHVIAEHESAASSFIVNNALKYIEEHYREKVMLSEVAEKTYVSQWHLSKLLNKHTGQNFSEILNGIRVEKAKELLEDPSLRIGDIAEEIGFLDMAHFSRVFKKQAGISANEYRNRIVTK